MRSNKVTGSVIYCNGLVCTITLKFLRPTSPTYAVWFIANLRTTQKRAVDV